MSSIALYFRLARSNLRRESNLWRPYALSCVVTVAMFYIMFFVFQNDGLSNLPGALSLRSILGFGTIVVGLFSGILIFYTNSHLIKTRRRELGLYSVLGMERRHISGVMVAEALLTFLITTLAGFAAGILFSKLSILLLMRILAFPVPFGFSINLQGIIATAALFSSIHLLVLVWELVWVGRASPSALLRAASEGEREPRTRWPLAIFGLLCLTAGYAIAVLTESPIAAIPLFFLAVILVIAGTYSLFTAGSIAVLKLMRKNKSFYYKPRNFTTVSGMIYRMRRNAAGLASICILSTMVLVMVGGTVCVYTGIEDVLYTMYPRDIGINLVRFEGKPQQPIEEALGFEPDNLVMLRFYADDGDWNQSVHIGDKLKKSVEGEIYRYSGQDYPPNLYVGFDLPEGVEFTEQVNNALHDWANDGGYDFSTLDERERLSGEVYMVYGGFLYLGLLLGSLFLAATVLIIYYKQIAEGLDDRARFEIMRKVGMGDDEIRAAVTRQILLVFFLPVTAAAIHVAFAFPLTVRMLALLNVTNVALFAKCTAATLLIYLAVYAAVYSLTAKSYTKIVGGVTEG